MATESVNSRSSSVVKYIIGNYIHGYDPRRFFVGKQCEELEGADSGAGHLADLEPFSRCLVKRLPSSWIAAMSSNVAVAQAQMLHPSGIGSPVRQRSHEQVMVPSA